MAAVLAVAMAACGPGGEVAPVEPLAQETGAAPTTTAAAPARVRVRVHGRVERHGDGLRVCPGGQPPCWSLTATPGVELGEGYANLEGTWQAEHLTAEAHSPAVMPGRDYTNPCGARAGVLRGPRSGDVIVSQATSAAVREYAGTIPDAYVGEWLHHTGPVLVVAVTRDADTHQAELSRRAGPGVCVTDEGFRYTHAELDAVRTAIFFERRSDWTARDWTLHTGSISPVTNRVELDFDQIDQRLVSEIAQTWGDRVVARAAIEVLEGTVDVVAPPPPGPDEIVIKTGPRGALSHLVAGRGTLRYDLEQDCVYVDSGRPGRTIPTWPHGTRALRDPVRIVDGYGRVIVEVDKEFEFGGSGSAPRPDEPLPCGGTITWSMASFPR